MKEIVQLHLSGRLGGPPPPTASCSRANPATSTACGCTPCCSASAATWPRPRACWRPPAPWRHSAAISCWSSPVCAFLEQDHAGAAEQAQAALALDPNLGGARIRCWASWTSCGRLAEAETPSAPPCAPTRATALR